MARNSAKLKEENTVSDTETEAAQVPTRSLFATAPAASVEDVSQEASEEPVEAVAETAEAETVEAAGEAPEASEEAPVEADQISAQISAAPSSEANLNDLDSLSVEELRRQQEEINRRLEEKTNAEKKGILDQVVLVIAEYGITTEEVIEALGGYKPKRKGTPAKIKFRDPVSGAEWSGRGKEPLWIRGKDRKEFAIGDAPTA